MASKEKKTKDKAMAGYDPAQYNRMTMLFVVLSLVNVVFVILAFMRTGYGLYHAEEALSRVSKVTQCVHSVNESAQNMVIHWEDSELIAAEAVNIDEAFRTIEEKSAEYREINLDDIDKSLQGEFESASQNAAEYKNALKEFTDEMTSGGKIDPGRAASAYSELVEPTKLKAETSINNVFNHQSSATTQFFFRAAQQFLFVLLFLLAVMVVGIVGISRMRKNAREAAESLEQERERVERQREKTKNLAYCNLLTGFKNYYGMEKDLSERINSEEFNIILLRFNKFSQINEVYGRGKTDDFLAMISQELTQNFESAAEIYSTSSDEFCLVMNEKMSTAQAEGTANRIATMLSKSYNVDGSLIQQTVSCCYYLCTPDAQSSFSQMFCTLDRAMSVAKSKNAASGTNVVLNVNALS